MSLYTWTTNKFGESYKVTSKEYYRAGAWNALIDARACYDEGLSKGLEAAMKRFRTYRTLATMNPTTSSLVALEAEYEQSFLAKK